MGDLGFAFNDMESCDRVMRIEITSDTPNEDCNTESTPVPDAINSVECSTSLVKVKTLNICSHLLASESAFFRQILENGMMESDQTGVTLKINASEEAALMDLLNFMYINSLSATTIADLMDVQMVAEKFEVNSCLKYCSKKLPMPLDQCELHNPVSVSIQALKDAAKKHLVEKHRDLTTCKSQEDAIVLPLSALEVVLGSDGLRVNAEEDVFDFIVKWGIAHYPKLEERREVLTKRLARFINYPYLCPLKLTVQVLKCPHLDPAETWRLALKSFKFNIGDHRMLVDDDNDPSSSSSSRLIKRAYKYRPVKVVYNQWRSQVNWKGGGAESGRSERLFPKPGFTCVVYLNLTKGECNNNLFEARESVFSQPFLLGLGRSFSLLARCRRLTSADHFSLHLHKRHRGGDYKTCTVDFEFQVMKRSSEGQFESIWKTFEYTFKAGKRVGNNDLFGTSWTDFMADESPYFIDGIVHLRALVTLIKNSPE